MSEQGERATAAAVAIEMAKQMADLRVELTLDDLPNDWASVFGRESGRAE